MDTTFLALTTLAFLVAGTVKGVVGLGLPVMAIGLMTFFVDPRTAVAIVLMPMIATNGWQVFRLGEIFRALSSYRIFSVLVIVGVILSTLAAGWVSDQALLALLGFALLLFVSVNLFIRLPRIPDAWDAPAQVVMGLLTGLLGGLTAVWAPTLAMYLAARHVPKDEFVRASGLLIFVGAVPLALGYVWQGFMTGPLALISAAMLVPALAGFTIGEYLRARMSTERFRIVLMAVFLLLGLNLLRRAFF